MFSLSFDRVPYQLHFYYLIISRIKKHPLKIQGNIMIKGSKGIIDACLHAIRCIP